MGTGGGGTDFGAWQESWDRQQEWYMPDREERFRIMLDMTEALVGTAPRVLDLACGTGSITDRVLRRFPEARSTAVDRDPALLALARGTFAGDARVDVVEADLTAPDWYEALPHATYDVVLTATALHWMPTEALRTLYGQLAPLVREGGAFMNADHMPDPETPRVNAAERALRHAVMDRAREAGAQDWDAWWAALAEEPELAGPVAARMKLFGAHSEGDTQPPSWHAATLREAGFAEARTVWASPSDALVLGLR
ncbi:trans-aconitate 2-methyltransferase [Streptomyces sp. NEAU-H3]|uniref:class I SAM-dependent methyltransferase n=1 Tax=unclassified Streptomyces TaxID=2593676 RepID=UPI00143A1BDF|nr:class I SAM-dependent methyltransferase [Streptomyces sp. NEAU-H3]NJA58560.1 class I SAM-dependent methyltransferase [Streptomyces sp. NEAU-H3]